MKAFEITEQKAFMSALLVQDVFDRFAVSEVSLLTACRFEIDGQRNGLYYTDEEKQALPETEYMLWSELKAYIYQIVKGNKTPNAFRIVFRLTAENTANVVASIGDGTKPEEVGGLFLNLQYEHGQLMVISGTAMKTFTLSKTVEQAWDGYAEKFLKKHGIAYELR